MHQLRVLGTPELLGRDGSPVSLSLGKPLGLLVYVACSPSPVSRDELAEILWPESDRERGRHSVRQALWVLRRAVGEDLLENNDPISTKSCALEIDLDQFTAALSEGRMNDAEALWRGPVMENFDLGGVSRWNHWKDELRTSLEHRFSRALLKEAETRRAAGEAESALAALEKAREVEPTSRAPHFQRIELLLELVRLDAAREAIAEAGRVLRDDPMARDQLARLEERLELVAQEERSRAKETDSIPLEFVGRSQELATLQALWQTTEPGHTGVALITGPPGIGKTRAAQEFVSGLAGTDVEVVTLKGTRAEEKLRWSAAADLARHLLRLPGSAAISSASDSLLRAMLPSLGKAPLELQAVNGVSPAAILDATTDLLEGVTFESRVVLLLDDFQWMDPESRSLFLGLTRRCENLRLLFLFVGRLEKAGERSGTEARVLTEEAGARWLRLRPLIREEVGEILALGAAFPEPADADRIVDGIYRASGGSPLFVREILRDLHDRGIIRQEDHGWVFHTDRVPQSFVPPENIRALLRERLDRLSVAAATVAVTLARLDRSATADALIRATQLSPLTFDQATGELLERGVIEWVDGPALDFVHDELRDTAKSHLRDHLPNARSLSGRWSSARSVQLLAAALLILLIPVGILAGREILTGGTETGPLPFGGGTILFAGGREPPVQRPVTGAPPEEWTAAAFRQPPPPGVTEGFRGADGDLVWFGVDDDLDGPDMVRILPGGDLVPLFPGPGDQTLDDMSPDGTRVLFLSENPTPAGKSSGETFSHSLYIGSLDGTRSRRIFRGRGKLAEARWAPNGDLVAFVIVSAPDTLAVYSTTGSRVGALPLGNVLSLTWCGSAIVASEGFAGDMALLHVDVPGMTVDTLASVTAARGLACSPDGTALVYLGVVDGRLAPVLREMGEKTEHLLPAVEGTRSPVWLPTSLRPVPTRLETSEQDVQLPWGKRRELSAWLIRSDSSVGQGDVYWESLDPAIASVSPEGVLTGNSAGVTSVLARWGFSLADTIAVRVLDDGPGDALLIARDQFEELDSTKWILLGRPPPEVGTFEGEPALYMRGDEKYADGLLLRDPIPLDRGLTLEAEFRMRLTNDLHQSFSICLEDGDPESIDLETGELGRGWNVGACAHYPAGEGEKLNRGAVLVQTAPGVRTRVEVPESLPTDGWTHMALQVRADGDVSIVVNHTVVGTNPVRLAAQPRHRWNLIVQADAIGTDVLVRNLAVWKELRYAPAPAGSARPGRR